MKRRLLPAWRWPWQRRWDAWWQARHPASDTTALTQRNLYILPSRPGFAFVLTLLVLLLASINDQLSLGYLLTFVLAGAGLASMHATHGNLRGLKLDLKTPAPTHAGQPLTLDVRLHNPGTARFGVGLRHPDVKASETAFADVPAQGHAQLQLQLSLPTRGRHALPRLRIESQFPFGLFVTWSYWRPAAMAWVYPAPEVDAPPAAAVEEGLPQGQGQPGLGDDPGLRPYRHGDSPRQILWKKSALALAQPQPPGGAWAAWAAVARRCSCVSAWAAAPASSGWTWPPRAACPSSTACPDWPPGSFAPRTRACPTACGWAGSRWRRTSARSTCVRAWKR